MTRIESLESGTPAGSVGELAPVSPGERVAEIDILRGFALLGICIINIPGFYAPYLLMMAGEDLYPHPVDKTAEWLVSFLGSGKFNSMFSFLFGVGFAIQMGRAATNGAAFVPLYLRRLLVLFLFGVAHILFLWDGDVLHMYALLGLPLILLRKVRDGWLWAIAALCVVAPSPGPATSSTSRSRPSTRRATTASGPRSTSASTAAARTMTCSRTTRSRPRRSRGASSAAANSGRRSASGCG